MLKRTKVTKINVRALPSFDIFVNIPLMRRKFRLTDIQQSTKIKDLKQKLELFTGIPTNLQRLHYLDKEDLVEESDLRSNDIVQSATLTLQIWRTWQKLVSCVLAGDVNGILSSEICEKDTSIVDPVLKKFKNENTKYRLGVALFIASHRGQKELVGKLIELGSDIDAKTILGRTALHAAAASGQSNCIDFLLERGACTEILDDYGKTASAVANDFGNRESEKKLFLFQWQKRAESTKPKKTDNRIMMHQQFDSGFPIWRKGKYQQIYLCKTLPVGEFIGTAINAPKTDSLRPPFQGLSKEKLAELKKKEGLNQNSDSEEEDDMFLNMVTAKDVKSQPVNPHHPGKRILLSHDEWLREKEAKRKEKIFIEKYLKMQEEKLKPWEKETKHGKRIEGKVMSFMEWQQEKLKARAGLTAGQNEDKPKRRIEIYEEYDNVPSFEKNFLQNVESSDHTLLKS